MARDFKNGITVEGIPVVDHGIADAKGDLLAATGNNQLARVPVGTDGQALVADSSQSAGVAWATLAVVPTGAVLPYAGSTAPEGYRLCNGAAVSRTTYAALFEVIGTTYGAGDGSTTFNLPDLRQRFPLGKAASGTGSTLGDTGGAINHTHTGPSHTHTLSGNTSSASAGPASGGNGTPTDLTRIGHTHGVGTLATGAAGTGTTGASNPPYLVLNYIIKT